MRLHMPLVPHGSGAQAVIAREPSRELLFARGGAISLPAEASDTGQGTPMLAPAPSTYSLNCRRLQAAGHNASRPGPLAPVVMVSCDQQDPSCSRTPASSSRGWGRGPSSPDAVRAPGKGRAEIPIYP